VELTARDGYRLGATLFQPAASNGRLGPRERLKRWRSFTLLQVQR